MKIVLATLLPCAALAGCAIAQPIQGPNAKTAYVVQCSGSTITACYEKAAEVCPSGYQMLDRNVSSSGVLVPAGRSTMYSAGPTSLLVECKPAEG
ncbi:MAG TPA: hypothetical protein VN680_06715 [Burkholderiaceae bacterium]|nr:hypothetical protein [Burkholderiaceae bacterium]